MSEEIRANYDQLSLLPQCFEDRAPRDHPARFIREFVEVLDLETRGSRPPVLKPLHNVYKGVTVILTDTLARHAMNVALSRLVSLSECRHLEGFLWVGTQ